MTCKDEEIRHRPSVWIKIEGVDPSLEFPVGTKPEVAQAIVSCQTFLKDTLRRAEDHSFNTISCLNCPSGVRGRVDVVWTPYIRKYRITALSQCSKARLSGTGKL